MTTISRESNEFQFFSSYQLPCSMMNEFNIPQSGKTSPSSVSPVSNPSPKGGKKEKSHHEDRIKRPMNAFMVWSQSRRQAISAEGKKVHNSDISKMLGAEWRTMSDEEKLPFIKQAQDLREQHFRDHPDYVYRPRRRKRTLKTGGNENPLKTQEETVNDSNLILPSILLNQLIYNQILSQLSQPTRSIDTNKNIPNINSVSL